MFFASAESPIHKTKRPPTRQRPLHLETLEPRRAPSGLAESLSPLPHLQLTKLSEPAPAAEHVAAPQKSKAVKLAAVKMYVDPNGVLSLTAPKSSSSAVALTVSIPQDQVAALKQAFSNSRATPAAPVPRLVISTLTAFGGQAVFHRLDTATQVDVQVHVSFNRNILRTGPPFTTAQFAELGITVSVVDLLHNDTLMDAGAVSNSFPMQIAPDLRSAHVADRLETFDVVQASIVVVNLDLTFTATGPLHTQIYNQSGATTLVQDRQIAKVTGTFTVERVGDLAGGLVRGGQDADSSALGHSVSVSVAPA